MTETPSGIEWYLARDGHQHGPLSESEMRAFVDFGHMRQTDLIWRAGFDDWLPAPNVFSLDANQQPGQPRAGLAAPDPVPAPPIEQPAAGLAALAPRENRLVSQPDPLPAPEPAIDALALESAPLVPIERQAVPASVSPQDPLPLTPADLLSPDQLFQPPGNVAAPIQMGRPASAMADAVNAAFAAPQPAPYVPEHQAQPPSKRIPADPQELRHPVMQRPAQYSNPAARVDHRPADSNYETPFPAPPLNQQERRGAQPLARQPLPDPFDTLTAQAGAKNKPRKGSGAKRIAAALTFAVLAGAAGAAYLKRDQLIALLPPNPIAKADTGSGITPFAAAAGNPDTTDQNFQRSEIWRHIKREFPEWYADRVQEAVKLAGEQKGDTAIAKHLAEAVVALRRKHADQALTASPERLRFVATAFLDNLQALSKQNVEICYGFISQGETFPAVLDMLQKQSGNEPLQKQVIEDTAELSATAQR
jgi:GYF domain 2